MPTEPAPSPSLPDAVVRGLVREQLGGLELLAARLAAARQGITQGRAAVDEVKQAEETVEWLRRLTREVLLDLGSGGLPPDPADAPRSGVERAAANAVRRWAPLMPQVELRVEQLDKVWVGMPAVTLERILQALILEAGRRARSLVALTARTRTTDHVDLVVEDDGEPPDAGEGPPGERDPVSTISDGFDPAATRWLAERWGGDLQEGRSEELGGTAFRFRVPVAEPPAGGARIGREDALEGIRVAVVDDEPALLRVVSAILERSGAAVTTFGGGFGDLDDVATRVEEMEVDVVLLDVHLGPVSGLEVLAELERRDVDVDRIILMSGSAGDVEDRAPVPVVGKPPDWAMLLRRIRAVARP